ncbi:hypothetical protein D9619_012023 [Psilocybe cf. subviscida]|uniref:Beta-xylanase n=1 Tax=Psilocybe cf. subviscida TaxID=2480587 RepID=A0A8H5EZ80_9AGAR|nr:hypothetical protein D9619_012023 [Psilocybe cf. subviscida]
MSKLLAFVTLAVFAQQAAAAVPVWGQCGGQGWTGGTDCESGTTCVYSNAWYSQCLPGSGGGGSTTTRPTTTPTSSVPQPTGSSTPAGTLNAKFVARGKKFWGTCADPGTLSKTNNANIIKTEFGQVTPENSMKWDATEPSRGQFTFSNADNLVNWAVSNGKLIRGHTLVWHAQLPDWVKNVNDRSTLTTIIQNHVSGVAGRFKGKIYDSIRRMQWDVVNECLNEDGSLRSSVFYNVLGESFVTVAFQAAKQADPSAVLYINDYNLDSPNAKSRGMVALVKRINANSRIIEAVGTQMHLQANASGGVQSVLELLATTGLPVAITELDIVNAASNDYVAVAKACLAVSACVGITSWGVSDADSWISSSNPLLFDRNYQKKAAYNALISAL